MTDDKTAREAETVAKAMSIIFESPEISAEDKKTMADVFQEEFERAMEIAVDYGVHPDKADTILATDTPDPRALSNLIRDAMQQESTNAIIMYFLITFVITVLEGLPVQTRQRLIPEIEQIGFTQDLIGSIEQEYERHKAIAATRQQK